MRRLPSIALSACLGAASVPGCYRAHTVDTAELARMSGFDARGADVPAPRLSDRQGGTLSFDGSSQLWLHAPARLPWGGHFERIEIHGGVLWGRLRDGQERMVSLQSVRYAEVRTFSPGRTAGLVIGLLLAAGAVSLGVSLPLVLRSPSR